MMALRLRLVLLLLSLVGIGSHRTLARGPSGHRSFDVSVDAESGCCGPAGLVCTGANFTGVVEETLYFAHPSNTGGSFDWGNHDMADALGEAVSRLRTHAAFVSTRIEPAADGAVDGELSV